MSDILVEPQVVDPDTGEPLEAHIVRKEDQMRGYINGEPVEALCGKTWVPSRDYAGLPICDTCKEILERINKRGSN